MIAGRFTVRTRLVVFAAMFVAVVGYIPQTAVADDKPDFPKFEEVTKDMKVKEGFFTLYHDEKQDKLLARIPAGMLEKNFLWATSIDKGPRFASYQWGDGVVYFERIGKKLVLVEADPRYKKSGESGVGDAIARTYTDSIIKAIPIVTEAGGDPVIDLAGLIKSDVFGAGSIFGGRIDAQLSRYSQVRNFPDNTLIPVELAVMSNRPGGGGLKAGLYHSLSRLPDSNGYVPREADDRIGYFLTATKDWTTPHEADTIFKRYVNRWDLRKVTPGEAVSDVAPEKQIVFYIEKTVPVQYRRYVREGILEWNKAFEAAGLRNAIAVHQQTERQYADLDPEDVRYNFIRWIVTGRPFAMAPSRVNPFTGQILDADIIIDDSYVRYWDVEYEVYGPRAEDAYTDGPVSEFLARFPQADYRQTGFRPDNRHESQDEPNPCLHKQCSQTWGKSLDRPVCEIGRGAARSLALASMVWARSGKGPLPEKFIGQALKETVIHEVGHTLGLRHNFKASSWLSLDQIQAISADSIEPTTASVMDYNPYNFAAVDEEQGHFATPTIGPYDYWAIAYGYKLFLADPDVEDGPKDEAEMLRAIASRCAEPGLDYATDEDTSLFYPDPLVNRWDNGSCPIDFARQQMDITTKLWKDGLDWAVKSGEGFSKTRKALNRLLGDYGFAAGIAARMVGGQDIHRDHKGDPNGRPPIEIMPADKQWEALTFLGETVFSDASFQFTPELLNSLAAGRWGHWDSDDYDYDLACDIHDRILAIRSRVLFTLTNPFTLNRVYDAELKVPAEQEALTVVGLFDKLSEMIWSELDGASAAAFTNRKPMISSHRRCLQREHLRRIMNIVLAKPGSSLHADIHAVARKNLADLLKEIDKTLSARSDRIDTYSKAHLVDSRRRIEGALQAEFIAPESRSRAHAMFFFFGHEQPGS